MIKIAFITAPLANGSSVRGIGFYTKHLLENLIPLAQKEGISIDEISDISQINPRRHSLVHYPFFDLFYPTLKIFGSLPTVVTVHDVIPLEFPNHYPPGLKGNMQLFRQRLTLKQAKFVITDSYASVKGIKKFLRVPDAKIRLVYLAADSSFRPIKDSAHLKSVADKYSLPKKFALYVGGINWNKNLPHLIIACNKSRLPLVIVGKTAAEIENMDLSHPELSHIKNNISLFQNTRRIGFVPDSDLPYMYNLASVYLQPSFAEGFGLPVLEAMSCGTPVVCSQTHSLPELGQSAVLYCDPDSSDDISRKIDEIISHPRLAKNLSTQGLVQSARFSWSKTALDTLLVYKEALMP